MKSRPHYPGTPQHQAVLRAIVAHYENDPRILAVAVFGSLGRGNWDESSDIDLDVVIADGVSLNAVEELTQLCQSFEPLGEHLAVIIPDDDDAGDVVFESLLQMSVRYHPLAATHPNIVDTLQVLWGRIDYTEIVAAGQANRRPRQSIEVTLAECVRYAVVADIALQRRRLWDAVEVLHRLRHSLMELFTLTHGGQRPWQFFQATADLDLQAQLGHTLPRYNLVSVQESLMHCLDILEYDLGRLTNEQVQLPDAYQRVLKAVRAKVIQMSITIVEVRPDSAEAMQLIAELDAHLAEKPYPQESRHAFSVDKLVREGVTFFVARYADQLAGCGGIKLFGTEYGEVKRMYVRPVYRGLSLGKAMLDQLAEYARERNVRVLRLETGIYQTEAVGLYEACGFQRRPPFGEYRVDPLSIYFEKSIA